MMCSTTFTLILVSHCLVYKALAGGLYDGSSGPPAAPPAYINGSHGTKNGNSAWGGSGSGMAHKGWSPNENAQFMGGHSSVTNATLDCVHETEAMSRNVEMEHALGSVTEEVLVMDLTSPGVCAPTDDGSAVAGHTCTLDLTENDLHGVCRAANGTYHETNYTVICSSLIRSNSSSSSPATILFKLLLAPACLGHSCSSSSSGVDISTFTTTKSSHRYEIALQKRLAVSNRIPFAHDSGRWFCHTDWETNENQMVSQLHETFLGTKKEETFGTEASTTEQVKEEQQMEQSKNEQEISSSSVSTAIAATIEGASLSISPIVLLLLALL